jgi:hypothetical protein
MTEHEIARLRALNTELLDALKQIKSIANRSLGISALDAIGDVADAAIAKVAGR